LFIVCLAFKTPLLSFVAHFFSCIFAVFLCTYATLQRPAQGTVQSQVATHQRTDRVCPCRERMIHFFFGQNVFMIFLRRERHDIRFRGPSRHFRHNKPRFKAFVRDVAHAGSSFCLLEMFVSSPRFFYVEIQLRDGSGIWWFPQATLNLVFFSQQYFSSENRRAATKFSGNEMLL
jgi:hypothetical protein